MRDSYWNGAFPNQSDFVFSRQDAMLYLNDDWSAEPTGERKESDKCFISVRRIGTAKSPKRKILQSLNRFAKLDRESWGIGTPNFVAYIWGVGGRRTPLVGFQALNIEVTRRGNAPISEVFVEPTLVYVRRLMRRQGFGSMLAAAVCSWLAQCRVYAPYASRKGVRLLYYADYETAGGSVCSKIIEEQFRYMQELRGDVSVEELGWNIREFDLDVGK